jgi:hypothetical protein
VLIFLKDGVILYSRRFHASFFRVPLMRFAAIFLLLCLASCDIGAAAVKAESGRGSAPAGGARFSCTPTRVYDGTALSGALKGLGCASLGSRLGRWTALAEPTSLALLSRPKLRAIIWRRS